MIQVRHTQYTIMAWEYEKQRGIVYPATVSTDIQDFTCEVRRVVLCEMGYMRFVSLVFDADFTRNYIPMREFLNSKKPECISLRPGEERERYNFLMHDDNSARELYKYFFSHAKVIEYPDGYKEFEFIKDS